MSPDSFSWVKAGAVCLPLYYVFWKMFFGSWDNFLESLRYWFQPDWLSVLRGEYTDDFYASLKMLIFLLLCAGSTYFILNKFFL
jgi:hypothetical protein